MPFEAAAAVPARSRAACSPILLMPNALFSRRDEVSEKGRTSWVTMVPPPMKAYVPPCSAGGWG